MELGFAQGSENGGDWTGGKLGGYGWGIALGPSVKKQTLKIVLFGRVQQYEIRCVVPLGRP